MRNYYVLNTALRLRRPGAATVQIGGFRLNPGVRMPLDEASLAKHRRQLVDLSREGIIEIRDAVTGDPVSLEPPEEAPKAVKASSEFEIAPAPSPAVPVADFPKKGSSEPTNPDGVPTLSEILEMGSEPEPPPEPEPIVETLHDPEPVLVVVTPLPEPAPELPEEEEPKDEPVEEIHGGKSKKHGKKRPKE